MSFLMQTWVTPWWAGKHEGKEANASAGTRLPCKEQIVARSRGSSRGGTSSAAVMLPVPGCRHQPELASLPCPKVG